MWLAYSVRRWEGFQIRRDGHAVRGIEVGCTLDNLAHARADDVAVRLDAGLEETRDVGLAPGTDAADRVAADIRGGKAVGSTHPVPGEMPDLVAPAQPVARGVAFAAMSDGLHEI